MSLSCSELGPTEILVSLSFFYSEITKLISCLTCTININPNYLFNSKIWDIIIAEPKMRSIEQQNCNDQVSDSILLKYHSITMFCVLYTVVH